jgi:type VI protein secretion system component Hcp
MTTNIDHELTETELDQVAGGKPSAAPKQDAFPTETIKLSYGAIQWDYTKQ